MRRSAPRAVSAVAALAALAAFWWWLAPPQLGGRTSYAVVYGVSMEPHLHRGDLVLLRRRPDYRVGEVVGYHSRELHRNVLHRIVARDGDRFTFKGDNNGFRDPERPLRSQLFGREWLVLPGVGAKLATLRSPRNAAIAVGLTVLVLGLGGGAGAGRRRSRRLPSPEPEPRAPRAPAPPSPAPGRNALATAGVVLALAGAGAAVAGAALGAVALSRPVRQLVPEPSLYRERGTFSYAAAVPVGAVYQRPGLHAPQPVFLRLVHRLRVSFAYRVRSSEPSGFAGRIRLDAVLGDGGGWSRRIALGPERRFSGGRAVVSGTLDLDSLSADVAHFERLTGEHGSVYAVALAPRVRLRGLVGGRPVHDLFAPRLALSLDQLRLEVAQATTGAPANGLVRTTSVGGSRSLAATLGAFGRELPVRRARTLALEAAGAGIVAILVGSLLVLLARRGDEVGAIERRYGDLIVPVAGARPSGAERRVTSMEALVRLAEQYERLILHEVRDDGHAFLVDDAGLVYRYEVTPAREDPGYRIELPDEAPTGVFPADWPARRLAPEDA